jgi:hypothetical protein
VEKKACSDLGRAGLIENISEELENTAAANPAAVLLY